jgi:hypothetical protein
MILDKKYLSENYIAFHCKTFKSSVNLISVLHEMGFIWSDGYSLLAKTNWDYYVDHSCYYCFYNAEQNKYMIDVDSLHTFKIDETCEIIDFEIYRVKKLVKEFINKK